MAPQVLPCMNILPENPPPRNDTAGREAFCYLEPLAAGMASDILPWNHPNLQIAIPVLRPMQSTVVYRFAGAQGTAAPGYLCLYGNIPVDGAVPEVQAHLLQPCADGQRFIAAAGGCADPGDTARCHGNGKCSACICRPKVGQGEGNLTIFSCQCYLVRFAVDGNGRCRHGSGDPSVVNRAGQAVFLIILIADYEGTIGLGGHLLRPGFPTGFHSQRRAA